MGDVKVTAARSDLVMSGHWGVYIETDAFTVAVPPNDAELIAAWLDDARKARLAEGGDIQLQSLPHPDGTIRIGAQRDDGQSFVTMYVGDGDALRVEVHLIVDLVATLRRAARDARTAAEST